MRFALVGLVMAGTIGVAGAQDLPQITVRPLDGASGPGGAYVGPYGRDLPGVSMFSGRATPISPNTFDGGVPYPSLQKVPSEHTYSQSELPVLNSWRGTLGGGIPF
ncbi:MAG: hypothetical protein AAF318_16835 [Pseudomonadota bacterium]